MMCLGVILLLGACGYRFPGQDPVKTAALPELENAVVQVEGPGTKERPLLARTLKHKMESRLGLPGRAGSGSGDTAVLRLEMASVARQLKLEDREGRADQYEITIAAQPTLLVDGKEHPTKLPRTKGVSTYYELHEAVPSRTTRYRAEEEAIDDLVDALIAVLTMNR
jgi:outer membrane lipopolysaccharide assembly protein LptE/RlpB